MTKKKIKSKQTSLIALAIMVTISATTIIVELAAKLYKRHLENCVLCGRQIIDESSVTLQNLDGTSDMLDNDICMKTFQKASSVYGDNLT